MKNKLTWIKSLQVGDEVCDCKFVHQKIIQIHNESTLLVPAWVKRFLGNWPDWNWLNNFQDFLYNLAVKFLAKEKFMDRTLILEDGMSCSAMHCCDSIQKCHCSG